MQVIVTGSTELTDENLVWDALGYLWDSIDDEEMTVVHDGSHGAASFASSWVRVMRVHYRVFEDKHQKNWDDILRGGADKVLVFFHNEDDAQTLKRFAAAKLMGIETIAYREA